MIERLDAWECWISCYACAGRRSVWILGCQEEEMGEIGIPSKMGSNGSQPRVCVEAIKSLISSNFFMSSVISGVLYAKLAV